MFNYSCVIKYQVQFKWVYSQLFHLHKIFDICNTLFVFVFCVTINAFFKSS